MPTIGDTHMRNTPMDEMDPNYLKQMPSLLQKGPGSQSDLYQSTHPPCLPPLVFNNNNNTVNNNNDLAMSNYAGDRNMREGIYASDVYQSLNQDPTVLRNRSTAYDEWKYQMMMQHQQHQQFQQQELERRNLQYVMQQNLIYQNHQEMVHRMAALTNMQLYHQMMQMQPQSRMVQTQPTFFHFGENQMLDQHKESTVGTETFDSNDFQSAKRLPKLSNITRRGSQNIAVQSHSLQNKKSNGFRRPLTAYNFFFSAERDLILKILDHVPDSALFHVPKNIESSSIANKTCPTEAESLSNESASMMSNTTSLQLDDQVIYFHDLISNTQLSPVELAEHEESIKIKAQQMLDVHMEADRVKKPHRRTHGKIGFKILGKLIGMRWRSIDPERKKYFEDLAKKDIERYYAQVHSLHQRRILVHSKDN